MFSCKKQGSNHGGSSIDPHDQYLNDLQNNSGSGNQQDNSGNVIYVYSIISRKLHLFGCYHIDRMNKLYKYEYKGDIAVLLQEGFTICRDCMVPKVEKEEPEEDEGEKVAKEDATFLINKASKTFHTLECHNVKIIVEKNVKYTDLTLEEITELDEYRPCSICLKEASEEYDKKHPDEK